ncbi:hypothetical protein ABPG74_022845 [Tetrahymena malaccensis]
MVSAWSIPQAKRSNLGSTEGVPGPGQYKTENQVKVVHNQSPQYSIGQSGRTDLLKSDAPSPGTYKLPSLLGNEAPKYHIGEKRSIDYEEREKQKIPGPANYSPKSFQKNAPAFSIPKSDRNDSPNKQDKLNKSFEAPGPGYYDINKTTLNGPSYAKMGSQKREDLVYNKESPGPGKYNISQSALDVQRKSPKFSIGSQDRSSIDGAGRTTPGVGQYNLNKTMLSSKGGFIPKKNEHEKRDDSPGVGAYNIKDLLSGKAKFGSFGKEQRKSMANNNTPGPQHYEVLGSEQFKLKNNPKFTIGSSQRIPLGSSEAPGPQHYYTKDIWNSKRGATIGSRNYDYSYSDAPGPQSYNPNFNAVLSKKGAYTQIGLLNNFELLIQYIVTRTSKSDRADLANLKEKAKIPGPADYRNYEAQKFKTPQFTFQKSNRTGYDSKFVTPGPGQYNLPPKFADVPKYLMPNKPTI